MKTLYIHRLYLGAEIQTGKTIRCGVSACCVAPPTADSGVSPAVACADQFPISFLLDVHTAERKGRA